MFPREAQRAQGQQGDFIFFWLLPYTSDPGEQAGPPTPASGPPAVPSVTSRWQPCLAMLPAVASFQWWLQGVTAGDTKDTDGVGPGSSVNCRRVHSCAIHEHTATCMCTLTHNGSSLPENQLPERSVRSKTEAFLGLWKRGPPLFCIIFSFPNSLSEASTGQHKPTAPAQK